MKLGEIVMLPGVVPYAVYGRVLRRENGGRVLVSKVQCGDPRCTTEHVHRDQVWLLDDLRDARTYQPRADWELGRQSSPNALMDAPDDVLRSAIRRGTVTSDSLESERRLRGNDR